ncbi:MAG: RNase H1/viroplasmin domain-containing protein, partial [Bacillota bacterium]|nr:RNase H1/viroplasmin domain-containing protein [Bacillota bacterium]
MSKIMSKKNAFYAWRDIYGNAGIFDNWPECQRACAGRKGEKHGGFKTHEEAWKFAWPEKQYNPETNSKNNVSSGSSETEEPESVVP